MMLNLNTEETTDGRMGGSGLNGTPPPNLFERKPTKHSAYFVIIYLYY